MSDNTRTLAEVSVFAMTSNDLETLRSQKGVVSNDNPLRVHRYAEGFIVSLGMFYPEEEQKEAVDRLAALGLSKQAIEVLSTGAATGSAYIDINADAPGTVSKRSYMDISTGHLRVKDGDLLEGIGAGRIVGTVPVMVHNTEHGYIVDVRGTRSAEEIREFGFSEAFAALIDHAKRNAAVIVDFDQDADYEPGFSIFDQVTDQDVTADYAEYGQVPN